MSDHARNAAPTLPSDAWIPITDISPALRDLTGREGPGYRRLATMAADGKIVPPMEKQGGRFWGCYRSNLPALAAALGLHPKEQPTARSRRRTGEQIAA